MAALPSRPSLRSSNRNNTILNEVPLTHADQIPPANSRRGKHTRDSSLGGRSNNSVKRLRLGLPNPTHSRHVSRPPAPKLLPIRDRSVAQDVAAEAVRSLKPDFPQYINGTSTATQHAPCFNDNATLTPNTKDVSSPHDKRSLRSHDGCSRSKSELALYFPNYDDLVSIEPKKPGRTPIDPKP